jgi:alpha-1,6-mannosyltransferase
MTSPKAVSRQAALVALGLASVITYGMAAWLGELRQYTVEFLLIYGAAFLLYAGATVLVLNLGAVSRRELGSIFILAALLNGILVFTRPALSDDMYRYVWDGRVQAAGISPYRYPPNATELLRLRDREVWRWINRKPAVTIYPPAAEAIFALLWRLVPDSVRWFQVVMAASGLAAGALLAGLAGDLGRSPARVVIYLWSPLLIFETAHSAHVDALILPLLVGAWWSRLREKDGLAGGLLGLATAIKLYPAFLLPALWRTDHPRGRWQMPAGFAAALALCYLPYLVHNGAQVIGFLPNYLRETFNVSPLVTALYSIARQLGASPRQAIPMLSVFVAGVIGLWMMARPARDGETAIRRSVWIIGAITLLSQNLFPWYLLWLLPLLAMFLGWDAAKKMEAGGEKPVRPVMMANERRATPGKRQSHLPASLGAAFSQAGLLGADAWTGWWLFCGLIGLSYTFFIDWEELPWTIWMQYLPLYLFLGIDGVRHLWKIRPGH